MPDAAKPAVLVTAARSERQHGDREQRGEP